MIDYLIENIDFIKGLTVGILICVLVALYIYIWFEAKKLRKEYDMFLREHKYRLEFKKALPVIKESGNTINDANLYFNEEFIKEAVDKACNKVLSKKTRE